MKRIQQKSTLECVVQELRTALHQGVWDDKLPGARILSEHLGVSPPTVLKALNQLVEEGVLAKAGARKAYQILPQSKCLNQKQHKRNTKTVILLTHLDINQLVATTRSILELFTSKLTSKGWRVRKVVVDFLHVKKARASWDKIIGADESTPIIAVYGRPPLAEWALKKNYKILFFGGECAPYEVAVMGIRSHKLARRALARLVEAGHTKIVFPINDRPKKFTGRLKDATRQAIESTGLPYQPHYHNPESPYFSKDVIEGVMRKMLPDNAPTALIFLDWGELITAHCILAEHGLRVPEDVSLILLNNQVEAEWFHPKLTRFEFPYSVMARAMFQWLENGQPMDQYLDIPARFIEGDTVVTPRQNN